MKSKEITLVLSHMTAIVVGFVAAILLTVLFSPIAVIPDSARDLFQISDITFTNITIKEIVMNVHTFTPTTLEKREFQG